MVLVASIGERESRKRTGSHVFNVGTQELLIIFVLVFLLFGPRHIPEVARTVGKGLGEIRRTLQGVEDSVRRSATELPSLDGIGSRTKGPSSGARGDAKGSQLPVEPVSKEPADRFPDEPGRDPYYAAREGSPVRGDNDPDPAESEDR